jgi:hypothetical protein
MALAAVQDAHRAHELAHLLLEHTPGPAIGPGGCRVWDPEILPELRVEKSNLYF